MRNVIAGAVLAAMLVACGKDAAPPESAGAERADRDRVFDMPYLMRELDNGLRVIVVATEYPDIVTIQIPVQTGSRNEVEAGKSGFAHFFEHMMFRGTDKYPADAYMNILRNAGATQNAYTTDDYTNFHITFTREDLEKVIEIEADRFRNLSYTEDQFRTEALAVKGEYLKNFSDPVSKAYERVRALAFRKHTYRHTAMGFIEDIEAMPDQLAYSQAFFLRWYRPENTSVILVGDLDPEATFELVRKYWSGWEAGDYKAEIPEEPPPHGPLYEHIQWDTPTQPWLLMAFRGPAFDPAEKNMPAIDLLSAIYFSDSSELYRRLVLDDQSVDQLEVYTPDLKDPGLLLFYARLTDARYAADVDAAIRTTLARARTELVTARTLAETKSRLRYSFTADLDNAAAIGGMLARFVQFGRTPETVNAVFRQYDALTAEDIRDAANRYFVDKGRVTVTLSDADELPGVDGMASIDAAAAAFETAPGAPPTDAAGDFDVNTDPLPAPDAAVPVKLVSRPAASSPLVDVAILVHAGAALDPPGKKGLAALTAAMITDGGTEAHSIQQINAAMYPMAAAFEAQVDKEMTRLSGQVHRDNLLRWYALAREQLLEPGWRTQDFTRVRNQLINAVRTSLVANNDEELGKEVLYGAIYGADHPYGSLTLGNSDDIAALSLDDVRDFYRRYYTVENVTVGLAGGYPQNFAELVSNDLQSLPHGEPAHVTLPQPAALTSNRAVIVQKETPAVAVSIGFPIDLTRGDPDWVALWLVRSWFGEHRSSMGELYKRLREARGMNYGDYAYIEYFPRGMFQFKPDTNLGRQQQIFQIWLRPLRNNNDAQFATRTAVHELESLIGNGMTETDFESTRNFLAKYASLLTDGQSRQLGYAMDGQYYGTGDFADYVRRELARMTLADVNRVIRANLRTDNLQFVFVARDADDLRDRLVSNQPSPLTHDAQQPRTLLEEDRKIQALPLVFDSDDVSVIPADEIFR